MKDLWQEVRLGGVHEQALPGGNALQIKPGGGETKKGITEQTASRRSNPYGGQHILYRLMYDEGTYLIVDRRPRYQRVPSSPSSKTCPSTRATRE